MGSSPSPAKSGLVYRDRERKFLLSEDFWDRWGLSKLKNLGIPLHRLATMVRIADDDAAISSVLCSECVSKLGSSVYPAPLQHSSEEAGTTISVVDIALEFSGPLYRITRLNKNDGHCLTGVVRQARTRYLPPLRPPLVTLSSRVSWLAGALALDHQREPSPGHCRAQGLLGLLELVRLGHSFTDLECALRSFRHPRLCETTKYLALVMRWMRRRAPREREWARLFLTFMHPWMLCHGGRAIVPGVILGLKP